MTFVRITTKAFRRDLRRLRKSGYRLEKLEEAIDILASGQLLPPSYADHPLHGDFEGQKECHIGPDWLLRYSKDKSLLILVLIRTGTHRDALGIE